MSSRRVAITAGCLTPFARAGTLYSDLTVVDLARTCIRERLERTAVDPAGEPLMGPTLAVPRALAGAGITLGDADLVEVHEAFAARAASGIQALESGPWAPETLGRPTPVGPIDRSKLNVCGGPIALGHAFGATGARITTRLANEMRRGIAGPGLAPACAQGGMGFATVLER